MLKRLIPLSMEVYYRNVRLFKHICHLREIYSHFYVYLQICLKFYRYNYDNGAS